MMLELLVKRCDSYQIIFRDQDKEALAPIKTNALLTLFSGNRGLLGVGISEDPITDRIEMYVKRYGFEMMPEIDGMVYVRSSSLKKAMDAALDNEFYLFCRKT